MLNKFLMCAVLSLPLGSCGIVTDTAKQAAKDWWDENGTKVVTDASDAAKKYWEENRDEIINSAVDAAKKLSEKSAEEARLYVDQKLQEQRDIVVAKLVANGAKKEDIDSNKDGTITDEELQGYITKNPLTLWYAGGVLAAWWGLWQLRKRIGTKAPTT